MIPLSPFNQRLTEGDGAVAVILGCFWEPLAPIYCTASPLSTHERLPQFHSPSSSATTDIYWLPVILRTLCQVQGRKSWGEISGRLWKGAHVYLRSKLSASEMSLEGKETNAAALIKKNGPDQWAPSDCSACNFGRVQKNDAIIIIQLHGNQVDTLHP